MADSRTDIEAAVSLLSGHLKHLTSLAVLGVGALFVLVELELASASGTIIASAVLFLFAALAGITAEQKVILHYVQHKEIHRRHKFFLDLVMFLMGGACGLLFVKLIA